MHTYVVTYAQDKTPVHKGFWCSLQHYAKHRGATVLVIAGTYRNPTSKYEKHYEDAEGDEAYDVEVRTHLVRTQLKLCRNLTVYGQMRVQPTASNPLSGFEVFASGTSAIVGHPKRALQVVPTETRNPRVLWSTGACTVPNYSHSKAGEKGRAHHALGAVVVEIDDDECYFVRHLAADSQGRFYDLDLRSTPEGVERTASALSLTLGDLHAGREDEAVLGATEALVELIKPKWLVLHDVLDFAARSHHRKDFRDLYDVRFDTVEAEIKHARGLLQRIQGWSRPSKRTAVVRSNHDEHFERWLDDFYKSVDVVNAAYYHQVRGRMLSARQATGAWPMAFEQEVKHLGKLPGVRFLARNESLKLAGVEHGFHGDKGSGGARGTPHTYVKLGVKVTTGHTHTPRIMDGSYVVGVTADIDHGYNSLPCTWLHAHCVLYPDGKRQIIIIVNGRFRGGAREPEAKSRDQAQKA